MYNIISWAVCGARVAVLPQPVCSARTFVRAYVDIYREREGDGKGIHTHARAPSTGIHTHIVTYINTYLHKYIHTEYLVHGDSESEKEGAKATG